MEFNKEEYLKSHNAGMRAMSKEEIEFYRLRQQDGMMNTRQDYNGIAQNINMFGYLEGHQPENKKEEIKPKSLIQKLYSWIASR